MIVRLAFWSALAFAVVMALLPQPPVVGDAPDKFLHVAAFLVVTTLGVLAYPRARLAWLGAALSVVGAAIEIAQLIPALGRDSEYADWVADTGAIVAVLVVTAIARQVAPAMSVEARRRAVIVAAVLVSVLGSAFTVWQFRDRPPPPRPETGTPGGAEPLVAEMECIDRLMRDPTLKSRNVEEAVARCRGTAGGGR